MGNCVYTNVPFWSHYISRLCLSQSTIMIGFGKSEDNFFQLNVSYEVAGWRLSNWIGQRRNQVVSLWHSTLFPLSSGKRSGVKFNDLQTLTRSGNNYQELFRVCSSHHARTGLQFSRFISDWLSRCQVKELSRQL